ncbi:hypothetical protein C2E31_21385 [Rhodopirellula baltica]|nr:hypothetical protein C2E31_21385 [Rhodopirellula baltica]
MSVLVTCESGGFQVPCFEASDKAEAHEFCELSFRGADLCGARLASEVACQLHAPCLKYPFHSGYVDVARPLDNRKLFGKRASAWSDSQRSSLLEACYRPYHQRVEHAIERILQQFTFVLHLSVRSFPPVKRGRKVRTDVGLLYDASREHECNLCLDWIDEVYYSYGNLRLRRNYPARGNRNGLLSAMRTKFSPEQYLGVEIWFNRWWADRDVGLRDEAVYELVEGVRVAIGLPISDAA